MQKTLTAHEHPLTKVFSSDFTFRVPEYQRPYRWGRDQALQLLDDLEETLDREDDEPYFLGSLVLVQNDTATYEVIDGQQRLTTLTILLAILRDLVQTGGLANSLGVKVLDPGDDLDGIPSRPRLTLREQDAPFFRKYVQEPGNTEALVGLSTASVWRGPQQAIRDNAASLHERLSTWEQERLAKLARLVSTRTFLVVVSTPSLESAYRIFSVMNARGLDLTPPDIFKSQVVSNLQDSGQNYSKRWEAAEDSLGTEEFVELFRDLRMVVSGERPRKELLVEFPEQVLKPYLVKGGGSAFIDDVLEPYTRAFERTITPTFGPEPEWTTVNQWLKRLDMIDNKDWRPCALWAMVTHTDDPQFLAGFLQRLERLAATFLLRQSYTTPRVARYLELLNEVKAGAGLDAPSFELSEQERAASMDALTGPIYQMQARRTRYVLLRLDELLANTPGATYDHSIISIEHVLPQNPKLVSQWRSDFTDEDRTELTHCLGNLLLLNRRKNSQANNYEFADKKARYFTTATGSAVFALTTQVLGHAVWTPEVIRARQQELTSRLATEWHLTD